MSKMVPKEMESFWPDPPAVFRGAPFWAWNSELHPDRLTRAIESMHKAGMGGFFMHSRYGLKTPYLSKEWFRCIAECVKTARRLGMKAYLYDEDRWPSGAAGGLVTRDTPGFRAHILEVVENPPIGEGGECLGIFEVQFTDSRHMKSYRPLRDGENPAPGCAVLRFGVKTHDPSPWFNDGAYLDTMNPEAVAAFLRVTHEAYARNCGMDFGATIPAMFTDEPMYGQTGFDRERRISRINWTPALPHEFKRRFGYEIVDQLPELACIFEGKSFASVRYHYHQLITELFAKNFSEQVGRWCGSHSIALTGHYLSEESMSSQTNSTGSVMQQYVHMQWPGIDILTDQCHELATAKQCSSVADQLGKERVLSEMYGCTGWDWPLEGHKFVGDWQYAVGVNFRCQHLTLYSLAGGAKRDYPASIFEHSPWWPYYRSVEDYFGRLSAMLTRGKPIRDVLVINPVESVWGLFTTSNTDDTKLIGQLQESLRILIFTLSGLHYDWDFGEEQILADNAKVSDGTLKVGKQKYRVVIVPPCLTLRSSTVQLLTRFIEKGGKVLFVGRKPDRIDAKPDESINRLIELSGACEEQPAEYVAKLESLEPRRVSITGPNGEADFIWYMLREIKGGRLLFIQSHDRQNSHTVHVNVEGSRPVVMWDALSGERNLMKSREVGDRVEFNVELAPTGSALITLGYTVRGARPAGEPPTVVSAQFVEGPFDIELTESNTFPLDYCRFRFAGEEFSDFIPTLKADTLIRKRFGLLSRLGGEQQPWYLSACGRADTRLRGKCELERKFHVSVVPDHCLLAIEQPENFAITVNGKPVGALVGCWVDEDIKTIDISGCLQPGENEILLVFDYHADMEIEDMYLVGDFGVTLKTGRLTRQPGDMTLVAPPKQLELGTWVGQKLDFYGGSVRYKLNVTHPGAGKRLRISLPMIQCTAAAIHVGGRTFTLPWEPFAADITDALAEGENVVAIEVIGGRKNIFGPLHVPWHAWTGPGEFNPDNVSWTKNYLLFDHGLTLPIKLETLTAQ